MIRRCKKHRAMRARANREAQKQTAVINNIEAGDINFLFFIQKRF
jgi:hypothetical protein